MGKNIRDVRTRRGFSQSEVADWLGLTFQQVQKYEKGTNRMAGEQLHFLALKMGVPIESFFTGIGPGETAPPPLKYPRIIAEIENYLPYLDKPVLVSLRNLLKTSFDQPQAD